MKLLSEDAKLLSNIKINDPKKAEMFVDALESSEKAQIKKLVAIFTLTHKALEIGNEGLSASTRKRIKRYAQLNEANNCYMLSAFLIAQFGKNYTEPESEELSGDSLMESAMDILVAVQHDVGGGI